MAPEEEPLSCRWRKTYWSDRYKVYGNSVLASARAEWCSRPEPAHVC